jgi:Ribosomal protein S5, N-terminal domain
VLAVAGDGRGRLGIGEGKALEHDDATMKAYQAAIRNMRPIPRYEERTIYGEVEGKVGACEVQLKSKPPGTSISLLRLVSITKFLQDLAFDVSTSYSNWLDVPGYRILQLGSQEGGIR